MPAAPRASRRSSSPWLPEGVHRIVATVDEAPEHPDAAYIQGLLDARGPSGSAPSCAT